MNMRKLNGLVATYNCSGASFEEQHTAYGIAVKMLDKEIGCARWVSANVFAFLAENEIMFNSASFENINDKNILRTIGEAILKLGLKFKIDEYAKGTRNHQVWIRKI